MGNSKGPKAPTIRAADLDDRQIDGLLLYRAIIAGETRRISVTEAQSLYLSTRDAGVTYTVERAVRNRRGTNVVEVRCTCPDSAKQGRRDCQHRFAEKLLRGDVIVSGDLDSDHLASREQNVAGRRPARKRFAHDGRSLRSAQRSARVKMATELPRLILSLKQAWEQMEGSNEIA